MPKPRSKLRAAKPRRPGHAPDSRASEGQLSDDALEQASGGTVAAVPKTMTETRGASKNLD